MMVHVYSTSLPLAKEHIANTTIYSRTVLIWTLRGAIESVTRIKGVELVKTVRVFFPQGTSELSIIMRCLY